MYRLWSSGVMVSSSWFMRGMPRVVTLSTWVSPRWNRAEPWAVGNRSTSADSGRMSVVVRPSMRRPSSTIRLRTSFLVRPRTAALISPSRLGELGGQLASMMTSVAASRAALRSALAHDRVGRGDGGGAHGLDPLEHVVAVVGRSVEYAMVSTGPRAAT